ncbi:MAG: ImuA protein [Hyphomicrobiales bacterium]|nr:ImuA protein [Hyphomicrobiales bacterium]
MALAASGGTLDHLRQVLATIDRDKDFSSEPGLPLGLPAIDGLLGGSLAGAALHELAPAAPVHLGAVAGFALAIVALRLAAMTAGKPAALFIQTDFAALEAGTFYGPGLDGFGLPLDRLLLLRVPHPLDALWACEEALKSAGIAIVIAELPQAGDVADFTATRRLTLAARAGGGLGLLLRHRPLPLATAAATRWQIAAAPSTPDRFGGLGRSAFDLTVNRNRRGRCGRFIVSWDHHACAFLPQALPVAMAAAADDGSPDARSLRVG